MSIDKIFHLRHPLPEARQRLLDFKIWSGLDHDADIRCSTLDDEGIKRFECTTRQGELLAADIQALPGEDPNRILFRSVRGNVELAGLIELTPIRENLTEVALTLEYEGDLQKAVDSVERFLNRQLTRIENWHGGACACAA
jgi:ribosomal protein S28E/S33